MNDQDTEAAVLSIQAGNNTRQQVQSVVTDPQQPDVKNMGEGGTRKLAVCAAGIFFCYFYYGILQEKM